MEAKEAVATEAKRTAHGAAELELDLALRRAKIAPDQPASLSGFKSESDAKKWLIGEAPTQSMPAAASRPS